MIQTIRLSDEEIKYFEIYRLLVKQGAFDIKNGRAILHFDGSGALRKLEQQQSSWTGIVQFRIKQ